MEENQAEDDFAASARLRDGLSGRRIRRIRELQGCAVYTL
jgi:hypothetical protein